MIDPKKEGWITTDDGKMVLVEHIDEQLRASYGPQSWQGIERAISWEQKGKVRIRKKRATPGVYETRVMKAENQGPELSGPDSKEREPMTPADMLGEDWAKESGYRTRGVKKKTIAWVQDSLTNGGAEISNATLIQKGIDLGWEIAIVSHDTPAAAAKAVYSMEGLSGIIINNIHAFNGAAMRELLNAAWGSPVRYVKFEHDHREMGRPDFARRLFGRSRLNVFLSPMHLQRHKDALGINGIALPVAVDPKVYFPVPGIERCPGTALISNVRNFKTWTELQAHIDRRPDTQFAVIGRQEVVSGSNVQRRDPVHFSQMPKIYSEYEELVHLPDGYGAGERVVFEAALCGCRVTANERVGHMSWGMDLTDRNSLGMRLESALFDFWREIEAALE